MTHEAGYFLSQNFHLTFFVFLFFFLMAEFSCVFFHWQKLSSKEARIPPVTSQKLSKSGGEMKRGAVVLSARSPSNGQILFVCSAAAHVAYYF